MRTKYFAQEYVTGLDLFVVLEWAEALSVAIHLSTE
jgi:hypothetical protein